MPMSKAEAVVNAIIKNLRGRKGLGDEWDQIDDDVIEEIRLTWIQLVDEVLDAH